MSSDVYFPAFRTTTLSPSCSPSRTEPGPMGGRGRPRSVTCDLRPVPCDLVSTSSWAPRLPRLYAKSKFSTCGGAPYGSAFALPPPVVQQSIFGRYLMFSLLSRRNVLTMILAGGMGERLYPLTRDRAKPAVPFGGRYRIIDFVINNFVNSGFTKIKILTQFKSNSLIEHITR